MRRWVCFYHIRPSASGFIFYYPTGTAAAAATEQESIYRQTNTHDYLFSMSFREVAIVVVLLSE